MSTRRALNALLFVLLLAPLAVQIGGCSILGLTVGSIVDMRRPPRDRVIPPGGLVAVRKGSLVELVMRDSSRAVGRLIGVDHHYARGYAARYAAWQQSDTSLRPPGLGEEIHLVERDGRVRHGTFAGFGYRSVALDRRDSRFQRVAFDDLREIRTAGGAKISADRLAELEANGQLPTRVALRIARRTTHPPATGERWLTRLGKQPQAFADTVEVHTDEITWVRASAQGSAARTGFFVGLVLDGIAITVLGIAAATYEPPSCSLDLGGGYGGYAASERVERPYDRWTGREVDEPTAQLETRDSSDAVASWPDERAVVDVTDGARPSP